ncbi:MAG: cyclase, partial [Nocardioides sp.]|nr:cyclase [Nocardioides sp.]
MAEQTTSSIVIDASPAEVMAVIADFDAYPEWAKGVKTADVVASYDSGTAGGRAEQVFFALDVSPIKDEYTLSYVWDADRQVTWTLVEGKMLRALDGAYVLEDLGNGSTEVTYQLALDVS